VLQADDGASSSSATSQDEPIDDSELLKSTFAQTPAVRAEVRVCVCVAVVDVYVFLTSLHTSDPSQ
jgi:hypothetical protein